MTARANLSIKSADGDICRARFTQKLVSGKSADGDIWAWFRSIVATLRVLVILALVAGVTVYGQAPKATDTTKGAPVKSAAVRPAPAKKPAPRLNWLPFDSVRATFPGALKPIFLFISDATCDHCEYMDTAVFSRPEVIRYINETLLPVRVDINMDMPVKIRDTVLNEAEFRKMLGIDGIPAYYFFSPNGRLIGLLDSQMDLLTFKRMLVYIRDGHFFKTPWEQFLTLPTASEAAINKEFQKK